MTFQQLSSQSGCNHLPRRKSKCSYSPTEVLPRISLTRLAQLVTTITIRTTTIITIITSDNRIQGQHMQIGRNLLLKKTDNDNSFCYLMIQKRIALYCTIQPSILIITNLQLRLYSSRPRVNQQLCYVKDIDKPADSPSIFTRQH